MPSPVSRLLVYVAPLALAAGAAAADPAWAAAAGIDVWNLPSAWAELHEAEAQATVVESEQEEAFRRIEHAAHVAARLADGSLTLAGAVTELEPALRDHPGFGVMWQCQYQTPTFRKGVARYAIIRVASLLVKDPARYAVLVPRLEAEYAAIE